MEPEELKIVYMSNIDKRNIYTIETHTKSLMKNTFFDLVFNF